MKAKETSAVDLDASNFDEFIERDPAVLVEFWADWCGPCIAMAPMLEELSRELVGRIHIGKVNIDQEAALAKRFGVKGVPVIGFFQSGEMQMRLVGGKTKDDLLGLLLPLI